jgi:hypothetical protein
MTTLTPPNAKAKDSFVASLNKNPGARDQNEFVKTLAETWTALSGALPPTTPATVAASHTVLHRHWNLIPPSAWRNTAC